jgi:hypothetical protein
MALIKELAQRLGLTVFTMEDPEATVTNGYTSDLLSDVMGNAQEESVLITIQAHKNTVAVASLIGIRAILLCNGRTPTDDMVQAAKLESVAILGTDLSQFISSHRIAALLGIE